MGGYMESRVWRANWRKGGF